MRTRKLLFILWAFLLVMVSCNKGDDSILEEASQIEATVGLVSAVSNNPISSIFLHKDLFCRPNDPFAIEFEFDQGQITFQYIVNIAHVPQMTPTSINWTVVDDANNQYNSTLPSIQTDFNYNTDYNITVDVEFSDGTLSSFPFCVKRIGAVIGNLPLFSSHVALCGDSGPQLSSGCSNGGGAAFTYIFPARP